MAFLDWFKGSSLPDDWHQLKSEEDLEKAILRSNEETIVLFKHSTRCGISQAVLHDLISEYDKDASNAEVYYLDLLEYRPISNLIAERLKVPHQSPQMIVLQNGEVVHDASHHAVSWNDVKKMTKV